MIRSSVKLQIPGLLRVARREAPAGGARLIAEAEADGATRLSSPTPASLVTDRMKIDDATELLATGVDSRKAAGWHGAVVGANLTGHDAACLGEIVAPGRHPGDRGRSGREADAVVLVSWIVRTPFPVPT